MKQMAYSTKKKEKTIQFLVGPAFYSIELEKVKNELFYTLSVPSSFCNHIYFFIKELNLFRFNSYFDLNSISISFKQRKRFKFEFVRSFVLHLTSILSIFYYLISK